LLVTPPAATRAGSASGRTITGALPPSSSESRVTVRDAPSMSSFPTRTLPVKLIFRQAG
jgi:hypothetical protein